MPETVITGLFSVLSAVIGGMIGYSSAICATVRKERNDAVLEFQLVFQRTLFMIDPLFKPEGEKVDVIAILKSDFKRQALAVMKFRQYIPQKRAVELEDAWEKYHAYEIADGHYWYRHFDKYRLESGDPRSDIDTDTIIKNINDILEYAKLNQNTIWSCRKNILQQTEKHSCSR